MRSGEEVSEHFIFSFRHVQHAGNYDDREEPCHLYIPAETGLLLIIFRFDNRLMMLISARHNATRSALVAQCRKMRCQRA